TCKCGKVIKLKWAYDEAYFKSHIDVFTHTSHNGAFRREVIARELFPKKFLSNKAIKYKQLSENELQLLDNTPNSKKKFMLKIQLQSNPIAKYIYNQDVEMGSNISFSNRKVFEGLCNIMVQIIDQKQCNKGLQNL
ncbi:24564_t:CDS:2, partial [Gigaspora margarita]